MSHQVIEVLEPGLLTTVQDTGRYGYQRFGVPVSGAMDPFSLRAANVLVGNEQDSACLEMTVVGPRLRFLEDTLIAVTGADLAVSIDGERVHRWQAVHVAKGSVLTSDGMVDGMRAYLAVDGGIDVPQVMGSRSTYMTSRIGGLKGRPLKSGDVISMLPSDPSHRHDERALPEDLEPVHYGHSHVIRAIVGPQASAFTPGALETIFDSRYSVSNDSDRVGYRLEGPHLRHVAGADIISDGSPAGAIQVPADGMPIVLMADRGPTGGYAKIATIISTDLGRLAQARPGDTISFKQVSVAQANSALLEQEAILYSLDPDLLTRAPEAVVRALQASEGAPSPALRETELPHLETRVAQATLGDRTLEFEIMIERD
jgi:antagonist of KipI